MAGSLEDPSGDEPDAIYRKQDRPRDRAPTGAQVRNDSIPEAQAEQTGHDEVGTLHPPVLAIGQQADRVSGQVEAVAGQHLDHGGGDEQRTGQGPGEQGAAALDARGRSRGHGAGL